MPSEAFYSIQCCCHYLILVVNAYGCCILDMGENYILFVIICIISI